MKKNLENLDKFIGNLPNDWGNREFGRMPLFKGQQLSFTGEFVEGSVNGNRFGAFKTAEGHDIAFSQIARSSNGLNLTNGKRGDMIKEFFNRIPEDKPLVLWIKDVKKQISSFGDSDNKQTFYIFEDRNAEAPAEEAAEEKA